MTSYVVYAYPSFVFWELIESQQLSPLSNMPAIRSEKLKCTDVHIWGPASGFVIFLAALAALYLPC